MSHRIKMKLQPFLKITAKKLWDCKPYQCTMHLVFIHIVLSHSVGTSLLMCTGDLVEESSHIQNLPPQKSLAFGRKKSGNPARTHWCNSGENKACFPSTLYIRGGWPLAQVRSVPCKDFLLGIHTSRQTVGKGLKCHNKGWAPRGSHAVRPSMPTSS